MNLTEADQTRELQLTGTNKTSVVVLPNESLQRKPTNKRLLRELREK